MACHTYTEVKPEYSQGLLQCRVKMQPLSVVNTGVLNFVKLEIEDMDQVPIHKDGGLLGIRNGRSDYFRL
jgi:hypothetical protein